MAASNRPNASLVNPARVSPMPPSGETPAAEGAPDSRYLRAARQIGHHWHSGGSSPGSSAVAVSQTSACLALLPPPLIVDLTLSATPAPMLRAPARISHRWKSPIGSLPGSVLILAD